MNITNNNMMQDDKLYDVFVKIENKIDEGISLLKSKHWEFLILY